MARPFRDLSALNGLVGGQERMTRDAVAFAEFILDCVPEDLPDDCAGRRTLDVRARAAALLSGYAAETTPEEEAVERRHYEEILRGAGYLMSGGKG